MHGIEAFIFFNWKYLHNDMSNFRKASLKIFQVSQDRQGIQQLVFSEGIYSASFKLKFDDI